MDINIEQRKIIDEITTFIMTSTDTDNLILSAFIAGLQAGRNQEISRGVNIKPYKNPCE